MCGSSFRLSIVGILPFDDLLLMRFVLPGGGACLSTVPPLGGFLFHGAPASLPTCPHMHYVVFLPQSVS